MRRILTAAAALSLLLLFAVATMWVHSYSTREGVYYTDAVGTLGLFSNWGRVTFSTRPVAEAHGWAYESNDAVNAVFRPNSWSFAGFHHTQFNSAEYFTVPYGFLVALSAVVPLAWIVSRYRRRRKALE
jgi:hypothetical protein